MSHLVRSIARSGNSSKLLSAAQVSESISRVIRYVSATLAERHQRQRLRIGQDWWRSTGGLMYRKLRAFQNRTETTQVAVDMFAWLIDFIRVSSVLNHGMKRQKARHEPYRERFLCERKPCQHVFQVPHSLPRS